MIVVYIFLTYLLLRRAQGIGILSFSGVECVHAFCDIVAKSVYGFTLARFKSYYGEYAPRSMKRAQPFSERERGTK